MPALEGDILALLSAGVLVFHHVLPLVFLRFANTNPDPSRHPALTAVLSIAALAFWSRAELLPRFLPKLNAVTELGSGCVGSRDAAAGKLHRNGIGGCGTVGCAACSVGRRRMARVGAGAWFRSGLDCERRAGTAGRCTCRCALARPRWLGSVARRLAVIARRS